MAHWESEVEAHEWLEATTHKVSQHYAVLKLSNGVAVFAPINTFRGKLTTLKNRYKAGDKFAIRIQRSEKQDSTLKWQAIEAVPVTTFDSEEQL